MGANYVSNGVTGEARAGNVTNNVTIGPDGLTLFGTARKTNKFFYAAEDFVGGGTPASESIIGNISYIWSFKKNADEDIIYSGKLSDEYEEGTDLTAYIEWAPQNGTNGDVVWDIDYNLVDDGDAIDTAVNSLTTTEAAPGAALAKSTATGLTIVGTSITKDTIIQIKVRRNGSSPADTYNVNAYFVSLTLEYTINKLGSN